MRTTSQTVHDRLLEYLIQDDYLHVILLKQEYPEFEKEINTYLEIWKLSNKLPMLNRKHSASHIASAAKDSRRA